VKKVCVVFVLTALCSAKIAGAQEMKKIGSISAMNAVKIVPVKTARQSYGPFQDLKPAYCPDFEVSSTPKGQPMAVCNVKDAKAVSKLPLLRPANQLKTEKEIDGFYSNVKHSDIAELGLWPEDSTDRIYAYYYKLVYPSGQQAGYAVIEGYVNSEMQSKTQITTKYNMDGDLVSISF